MLSRNDSRRQSWQKQGKIYNIAYDEGEYG